MKSRILNIDQVSFQEWSNGDTYQAKMAWVGSTLGSKKLGFN